MKDGAGRILLKWVVRLAWTLEMGVRRRVRAVTGPAPYRLAGTCVRCAKCCERPAIRVGRLTWHLPRLRALFLAWQRTVNGFELVEAVEESRTLLFRCGHFDWILRRCDSYASRPFMCRDYPRALLEEPWPELFAACGYRPVAPNAEAMREALARADLTEEQRVELGRKLYLE